MDIYKGTDFKGFTTPKGIFRTDDGTLYVADGGEKLFSNLIQITIT